MRIHCIARFLVILALVAACQKDQPLPSHQATATTPEAAASEPPPAQTSQPAASSSVPAAMPTSSPAPASAGAGIATTEGEQSGLSLTVTELKRGSGGTATLKFTIVNSGTGRMSFGSSMVDPSNSGVDYDSVGGVHMIDPVNKKKYFVVRDTDNRCVCSRGLPDIKPGERLNLWAKFPAPPDTQQVTIVVPHFIPMDDVPIS